MHYWYNKSRDGRSQPPIRRLQYEIKCAQSKFGVIVPINAIQGCLLKMLTISTSLPTFGFCKFPLKRMDLSEIVGLENAP